MTQSKNTFNPMNFGAEMMKAFAKPIDREAMMASHKKNLEALTEANKMAVDVMKSIAQLQTQYLKKTFEDMTHMAKDAMTSKPAPNQWEAHSLKMKEYIHNAIDHGSTIASTLVKSHKDMHEVFHKRLHENIKNVQEGLAKKKPPTKH